MGYFNSARLDERNLGNEKIALLKQNREKTLVIHYSCESFFNTHGRTPRVTSIAVKNRDNGTTIIFSIHLTAQVKNKDLNSLSNDDFDFLEKEMLKDFYAFVGKHAHHKWVHWNMRNASYGFEAISNRFRILGGNSKVIDDSLKYDLSEIFGLIYTYSYEKHKAPSQGQLLNASIRNKVSTRDALTGLEEATAFDQKDFLRLHMSTSRKVEMIERLLSLQEKKQLKVNVSIITSCGLTPLGIIEIVRNNVVLFTIWSILIGIIGAAAEPVIQHLFGTDSIAK